MKYLILISLVLVSCVSKPPSHQAEDQAYQESPKHSCMVGCAKARCPGGCEAGTKQEHLNFCQQQCSEFSDGYKEMVAREERENQEGEEAGTAILLGFAQGLQQSNRSPAAPPPESKRTDFNCFNSCFSKHDIGYCHSKCDY